VRVVQKNLVYITGLAPTVREDELMRTLRKPEFFGQYGNIQKISISNRKSSDGQYQSLGIYVTFEKAEEATRCIQAVHGSQNGDRYLKAQLGTTKYCSAWLKNEKCGNPGCMFLHEQGDEEDSYTRQDLSSMNSIHTQRPLPGGGGGSSRSASRQQVSQPAPLPASQAMARSTSKEGSEGGMDSSALPSSASWARNPQRSRRGSHATSGAASSPAVSMSVPAARNVEEAVEEAEQPTPNSAAARPKDTKKVTNEEIPPKKSDDGLKAMLRALEACSLPVFADFPADDSDNPPLFDIRGGERRRALREEEDGQVNAEQDDQTEAQEASEGEPEAGGSHALGGEPEERELGADAHVFEQRRTGAQPPIQRNNDGVFSPPLGGTNFGQTSTNPVGRTMTPQQLFSLRSQSGFGEQMPPGISGQGSTMFQNQGHSRQSSRFSFANESGNTTANVKLTPNPRIMAQQSSMMPSTFQSQGGSQFYGTSMPGPPPGLKATGTPPNMFGQGGFGGSAFAGNPKDSSNDLLQSLIGRSRGGAGQAQDAGKREFMISSFSNQYPPPSTSTPAPAPGLLASLYGNQPGAFQDFGSKQKKKGKKHRHANTSSSGGSGLVDLADPSILQARMQHQSQSNAGAGHGLFGGQSQGGYNPNMMYNNTGFARW
jgi:CCR4-NOT transcription complex subunit 4